jgi:hypothetical protein
MSPFPSGGAGCRSSNFDPRLLSPQISLAYGCIRLSNGNASPLTATPPGVSVELSLQRFHRTRASPYHGPTMFETDASLHDIQNRLREEMRKARRRTFAINIFAITTVLAQ